MRAQSISIGFKCSEGEDLSISPSQGFQSSQAMNALLTTLLVRIETMISIGFDNDKPSGCKHFDKPSGYPFAKDSTVRYTKVIIEEVLREVYDERGRLQRSLLAKPCITRKLLEQPLRET